GQRVDAVDDVSLNVPEGEFLCLIGPSGCGKSTLLQMIAGLVGLSSGAIVIDGKEIDGPGRERGMVFQRDSVFPWMRVIDNVEYGLKCRGVAAGARRDIAHENPFYMIEDRPRTSSLADVCSLVSAAARPSR